MAPVLVRDLVGEALVDSLRKQLVRLAHQGAEGLPGDEHDTRRGLPEAVFVDLQDVELGEGKRTEEVLVVLDDSEGEVRQLLHGALVPAGVGGHADRQTVARLFALLVLARENNREGDRPVDLRLQDVLVPLGAAADRFARRERHEGFLDLHARPQRVVLTRQVRLREPRLYAELPVAVSSRADQEVALDLKADLHGGVGLDGGSRFDEHLAVAVIEEERAV